MKKEKKRKRKWKKENHHCEICKKTPAMKLFSVKLQADLVFLMV